MSFQPRLLSARAFFLLKICPSLPPLLIAEPPAAEVGGGFHFNGSPSSTQTPGTDRAQVSSHPPSSLGQRPEGDELRAPLQPPARDHCSSCLQSKNPLGALPSLNTRRAETPASPPHRPQPRPTPTQTLHRDPRPQRAPGRHRRRKACPSRPPPAPEAGVPRSPQTPARADGAAASLGAPGPMRPLLRAPTAPSLLGGRGAQGLTCPRS